MKRILVPILLLATIFTSCKRDNNNSRNNIFKGPETQVHGGKAWTWVQVDNEGNPLRLAVTLNDAVLNSVPAGNGTSTAHDMMDNMWTLKFHPKAGVTEFNHVGMGWNPNGHEPEHIYDQPHFDFHFYMITPDEVAAIPPYPQAPAKFDNWPAASYFPANYFNAGGGVPMMGAHWIDPASHEFHGQLFTETFIFGSYDGKVTFYEPMITLAFLKNNNNFERSIPQPAKVQKSGYYPTKLRVVKHDGLTEIILDEFVYRTQS